MTYPILTVSKGRAKDTKKYARNTHLTRKATLHTRHAYDRRNCLNGILPLASHFMKHLTNSVKAMKAAEEKLGEAHDLLKPIIDKNLTESELNQLTLAVDHIERVHNKIAVQWSTLRSIHNAMERHNHIKT